MIEKVEYVQMLTYGDRADNLTIVEYEFLTNITWFPKTSLKANDISHLYDDGFLPDYTFHLTYEVYPETPIDTLNYEEGQFSKSQSFEIKVDAKILTYIELNGK